MAKKRKTPAAAEKFPWIAADLAGLATPIGDVRPAKRNPVTHDEANVAAVARSLETFGQYVPLVANRRNGEVVIGNARLAAAGLLGWSHVAVLWRDMTDAEQARLAINDNRLPELSEWNEAEVAALLADIEAAAGDDAADLAAWEEELLLAELRGADDQAADAVDAEPKIDQAAELAKKWKTRPGQLWTIPGKAGVHRLLCGDATSPDDVARVLDGATPNLTVTDPPWGVEYSPEWRNDKTLIRRAIGVSKERKVAGDDRADWSAAFELLPGDVLYCWFASTFAPEVGAAIARAGFPLRVMIVWKKQQHAPSRGHYHWQHEPCWYAVRKGASAGWIGDRKQSTVWEINSASGYLAAGSTGHSTEKPVDCMRRAVRNHKGDVFDPFVGSGTTIVAAEEMGRTCYAMDVDPAAVAVTLERLNDQGLKPTLSGRPTAKRAKSRKSGQSGSGTRRTAKKR